MSLLPSRVVGISIAQFARYFHEFFVFRVDALDMRTNPLRILVQRMADKGLLRVTPSPRDARCKLVALTAEGDVVSMTLSELKALISA